MSDFKSESRLTFMESTGVIIGHGIGSGVLTVPWILSHNNWWDFIWIGLLAFVLNLLLHLMVAELSYNNEGAQFTTCFELTLLKGKLKKPLKWIILIFLALSVLLNCVSYIVGSAISIESLTGINPILSRIIFFVVSMLVVFFGMKLVGICEKYCVYVMAIVLAILTVFMSIQPTHYALPTLEGGTYEFITGAMALYGVISFALSSVMSVPTVVKGLNGDKKKIFWSVTIGLAFDIFVVFLLAFLTLIGCGASNLTTDGALNDISNIFGNNEGYEWIKWVCAIFNILALATSFWANTLNLRDNLHEQTKLPLKICWLITAVPCLICALIYTKEGFTTFSTIAAGIQVATGLAIIVAYGVSRKKKGNSEILGVFGSLPFQIIVIIFSLIATVGSLMSSSLYK